MKPRPVALAVAVSLATLIPAAATAAEPLPLQSIRYDGTGCPQGSVGQSISNDRTSFTLIFDDNVASSGPGAPATENSKTCRIDLVLTLPHGWHLIGATLDRRGYVQLPAGARARLDLATTVDGRARTIDAPVTFAGPVARDYLVRTTLEADRGLARCNGGTQILSLLTSQELAVAPDSPAQVTTDSIDGKLTIAACTD